MLTKKFFKDWLEKKGPNDHAGTIGDAHCCPIATCLKENNALSVSVCDEASYDVAGKHYYKTMKWINRFVSNIDTLAVLPNQEERAVIHHKSGSVDAATCLKTLELKKIVQRQYASPKALKKAFPSSKVGDP